MELADGLDSEASYLYGCRPGEGIARIRNEFVPLKIQLSEYELDVIHGVKTGKSSLVNTLAKTLPHSGFSLMHEGLNELVQKHSVVIDTWCTQPANFERLGYVSVNVSHAIKRGRYGAWVRKDLLENNMILNQSVEHYIPVVETAAFLMQQGCKVDIDHYGGVDLSVIFGDRKIAFEFEISQKHNNELIQKYQNALKDHAAVYFISTAENTEHLSSIIGAANVIPRGVQFMEFLTELLKNTFSLSEVKVSV